MIFEKDSRICLCSQFNVNKIEDYNKAIRLKWKNIHKEYKLTKNLEADLNIKYINLLFPFEYILEIDSISLSEIEKDFKQEKKDLEKIYNESVEEDKKEIEKRLAYLEKIYKKGMEFLKKARSMLKIDLKLKDCIEDSKIFEIIEKFPEKYIYEEIEKKIDENFEVTACAYINLNKKLDLMHGYDFNRKLDFPKEITEQIGDAFIKIINLNIFNSPLGIKEIEFGENDDYKILNIKVEFLDNKLSNLPEKIKTLIDIIKLFIIND